MKLINNAIESHDEGNNYFIKMPVSVSTANLMNTTEAVNNNNINNKTKDNNNNIKTFRFEFSKGFIDELSRFSKVHQFDERRAYKEAWQKWKSNPEIDEIISFEVRRLEEIGYKGDIEDKMFKSGRYYFRKKSIKQNDKKDEETAETPVSVSQEQDDNKNTGNTDNTANAHDAHDAHDDDDEFSSEQSMQSQDQSPTAVAAGAASTEKKKQQRRPYITMSKNCIRLMDSHITEFSKLPEFKPSTSYDNFYQEMMSTPQMMQEIENIISKYEKTMNKTSESLEAIMDDIMDKIKKTYKNRYYRFVNRE